jgi:heme A synthase
MVVVGGLTRLTKSGLSMVEWRMFGERPPTSTEMWEEEFAKYKEHPEYLKLNKGRECVCVCAGMGVWKFVLERYWGC